jgi:molybdopterin synthase sulfur carrier subunit
MNIKVKLFGMLADELQRQEVTMNDISDVRSLEKQLLDFHPVFNRVQCRISVNRKLITDNMILHTSDEVAVMPPFSGG